MAGTPMNNVRTTAAPLSINLPNGGIVKSTHVCDIIIPGLPKILTGHIVPGLAMASLLGIRVLCKAGCEVTFTDATCEVKYDNKIILQGAKDPSTDLWTLPITHEAIQTQSNNMVGKDQSDQKNPNHVSVTAFTHSIRTRENAVKFAHQSLGNPKISTLLKALKKNFLKGCPNMTTKLVNKYLNASPATTKGHMKRPKKASVARHRVPTRMPQSCRCPILSYPCSTDPHSSRAQHTAHSVQSSAMTTTPMSITQSPTYFVLEHLRTRCRASCTTT